MQQGEPGDVILCGGKDTTESNECKMIEIGKTILSFYSQLNFELFIQTHTKIIPAYFNLGNSLKFLLRIFCFLSLFLIFLNFEIHQICPGTSSWKEGSCFLPVPVTHHSMVSTMDGTVSVYI